VLTTALTFSHKLVFSTLQEVNKTPCPVLTLSILSLSIPASPHLHIQVNTNGLLSFAMLQSPYLPTPFSLTNQPLVAPFWGDVDTRSSGEVFYRLTTNQTLLADVGMEIRRSFVSSRGFFPTSLFIATWNDVGYYENHTNLVSVSRVH